ncbi:MAG: hypothetical protein P8R42_21230 [Candidatus Binatia bacterium]|nr:hypothetical protein [Candidatus Binatia bacterium]
MGSAHGVWERARRSLRPAGSGLCAVAMVVGVMGGIAVTPLPAFAQDADDADENALLQAENERLRAELGELRAAAAAASADAAKAADDAATAGAAPAAETAAGPADSAGTSTVEGEYVPMKRVSLSVSRNDAGATTVIGTPWYRTVPDTGLLPLREFIQLRASPSRGGRPEQVWISLNRQGVRAPLGSATTAQLQIGQWTGEAPVVEQNTSRRRRTGRRNAVPPRRDETTVFAFPAQGLQKLAVSDRASFDAGPVHFEFTDEHIGAASALAARLEREEQTP